MIVDNEKVISINISNFIRQIISKMTNNIKTFPRNKIISKKIREFEVSTMDAFNCKSLELNGNYKYLLG